VVAPSSTHRNGSPAELSSGLRGLPSSLRAADHRSAPYFGISQIKFTKLSGCVSGAAAAAPSPTSVSVMGGAAPGDAGGSASGSAEAGRSGMSCQKLTW